MPLQLVVGLPRSGSRTAPAVDAELWPSDGGLIGNAITPGIAPNLRPQLGRRSPAACARAPPRASSRMKRSPCVDRREAGDRRSTRSTSGTSRVDLLDLLDVVGRCSRASSPRARCTMPMMMPRSSMRRQLGLSVREQDAARAQRPATPASTTSQRAAQRRGERAAVAARQRVEAALDQRGRAGRASPRAAAAASTSSATASARRSPRPAPRRRASARTR